jgi:hypothetical protein
MKKSYNKELSLRCVVCGSDDHFEYNEDKTYVKCTLCNKEYLGGYDELVEMNKAMVAEEVESMKKEVAKDAKDEITKMLKDAFKGNKYISFK